MKKKLNVIVDAHEVAPKQDGGGFNARPDLKGLVQSVSQSMKVATLQIDVDTLATELKDCYTSIVGAIENLHNEDSKIKIDNIEFTLSIDTEGKISLLSAVEGKNTTKAGIKFNLSYK